MDSEGNLNTASDPSKIIQTPKTGAKGLEETLAILHGANNRVINMVQADMKKGLLDADYLATLEAIGEAVLDGIAYLEHVQASIETFTKNFGKELEE